LDGPVNRRLFLAYVEQFLLQTLAPEDIVVKDDLASQLLLQIMEQVTFDALTTRAATGPISSSVCLSVNRRPKLMRWTTPAPGIQVP